MAPEGNQFRSFEQEIGVVARVMARSGGWSLVPQIGSITGVIDLPMDKTYQGLVSAAGVRQRNPVESLTLEVARSADDDHIIVTQRVQGDRYLKTAVASSLGGLSLYSFPPCQVKSRTRSAKEVEQLKAKPFAVWCNTMQSENGSNRADIWRVSEDGKVTLFQIFVTTLDDGANFQLVGEYRWEGQLYRRAHPAPYKPVSDDSRVAAVLGSDRAAQFLHDFVLVPEKGYENFEQRLQILLLPEFLALLSGVKDTEVWESSEDFWLHPEPHVKMLAGQGVVQFYVYGLADGSMGIVRLAEPIMVNGRKCATAQIRHNHIIDAPTDGQGLKLVQAGDIIECDGVVPMDNGGKQYPPLLTGVRVVYQFRDPV